MPNSVRQPLNQVFSQIQNQTQSAFQTLRRAEPYGSLTLNTRPIVWAIDAFTEDPALQSRTAEAIHAFAPQSPIQPVYVLNENAFERRGYTGFLKPALKSMAFRALTQMLKREEFDSIRTQSSIQVPRVILEPTSSLDESVKKLMRFSRRIGAQAIALGSHAGSSFARYFSAHFSDTLLNSAEVPLLISGPRQTPVLGQPKAVIFPTDFSPQCRGAYEHVLKLSEALGADLFLFHKNFHPIDAIVQTGVHMFGGGWVSIESYFHQLPEDHESEAAEWLKFAANFNVRVHLNRENDPESTANAILDFAKTIDHLAPVLAMVHQSSQFEGWLLGSVTRDVIRNSPYPVYLPSRIALS
jgi:nucleotide-binding universal stress UspA family protein